MGERAAAKERLRHPLLVWLEKPSLYPDDGRKIARRCPADSWNDKSLESWLYSQRDAPLGKGLFCDPSPPPIKPWSDSFSRGLKRMITICNKKKKVSRKRIMRIFSYLFLFCIRKTSKLSCKFSLVWRHHSWCHTELTVILYTFHPDPVRLFRIRPDKKNSRIWIHDTGDNWQAHNYQYLQDFGDTNAIAVMNS